ncbi:type II toxin-antitoxin system HicB family antitoxin [Chloroflexota bacterium]
MNKGQEDLEKKAEKLAEMPYTVRIMKDETTSGKPIFLLSHPELEGCMAQGETIEDGIESLQEATKEYIISLLEEGLDVPEPMIMASVTTSVSADYQDDYVASEPDFLEQLETTVQPHTRQGVSEVSLIR